MVSEFTTRQETCCFLSELDLIAAPDSESGVVKYEISHTRACSDLCVRGSFFSVYEEHREVGHQSFVGSTFGPAGGRGAVGFGQI